MPGDARQEALATISRLKRVHDIADEELIDHRELGLLREGHGLVTSDGSPGDRFVASASLAEFKEGLVTTVDVPVLEPAELAATVAFPSGRTTAEVNALAEWAAPVLRIATVVPEQGMLAMDRGLGATELTTGSLGLIPGAASREVTLSSRGVDAEMVRISLHAGARTVDLRDDEFTRRTVDDLVSRLLMRGLAVELIQGDNSTVGDQRRLKGLAATTITSVDAATGDKVSKVSEAVASVQQAWSERPIIVTANPTTLRVLREAATWRRDRLPDEVVIVPFGRLATGTIWVVAERTITLFSSSVLVEVSTEHVSDFIAGRAVLQPVVFAWCDVGHPSAAAKVVNF